MTAASIDIGSNTVLMLLAEISNGAILPIQDLQRIPRISAGLLPGGKITDASQVRLMNILTEYSSLIKTRNCSRIIISATSAFRKAANSGDLKKKIEDLFDTEVKILSGNEEAELAFLGTIEYGTKQKHRLVIDIGGGSTEIIYGHNTEIDYRKSFDTGVVSLSEKYFALHKPENTELSSAEHYIRSVFGVLPEFKYAPGNVVALAGTPVALACLHAGISDYDESRVEASVLSYDDIAALKRYLAGFSPAELLNKHPNILRDRQDLILSGTSILFIIMELLKIDKVIVSTKGVRYGALIKYLNLT